jgi:CubicO group peptidase (beta-lactamase class C family)
MIPEIISKINSFLDSWLQFQYEHLELPGYVVAVSIGGNVVFSKAYGYANLEKKEKLTTDHIFRVASHSKTFTATALMQLAEKGKLSLDDGITDHLPWLRHHGDSRVKHITLSQLMSHSAGLIRDGQDADFWQLMVPFPDEAKFKSEVLATDLIVENNKRMKYSNVGYALLGLVVEAASGNPYNDYMREHSVQPLGLNNTGPEFVQAISERLVTGYSRRESNKQRRAISGAIDTKSMSAATGFYSTAEDLCKYFSAHLLGTGKLISDESKKEMQRTQWHVGNAKGNEEYGLGFVIEQLGKRRLFGHSGGFPGQITISTCNSELDAVIVVLTNCMDMDAGVIAKGILGAIDHFVQSYDSARKRTYGELKHLEGRFLNLGRITEILQSGDNLISICPNDWQPFSDSALIEELEIVDDRTLKIVKTMGFLSEGELVHYNFANDGRVESLRYAGLTMWPEERYSDTMRLTK